VPGQQAIARAPDRVCESALNFGGERRLLGALVLSEKTSMPFGNPTLTRDVNRYQGLEQ